MVRVLERSGRFERPVACRPLVVAPVAVLCEFGAAAATASGGRVPHVADARGARGHGVTATIRVPKVTEM